MSRKTSKSIVHRNFALAGKIYYIINNNIKNAIIIRDLFYSTYYISSFLFMFKNKVGNFLRMWKCNKNI